MKWLSVFFFLVATHGAMALPLTPDEDVIIFPVSAEVTEKSVWKFPLHHWIFESDANSLTGKIGGKAIEETLELAGLSDDEVESDTYKQRVKWFLVDNKGWKNLSVKVSQFNPFDSVPLATTDFNGHAYTDVYLALKKEMRARSWIKVDVDTLADDPRKFYGEVQLIPENGVSVISDIDDTIKISEVLDKRKLLKNIFVNEYKAPEGMPELYQQLKEKGYFFHYVSASPWQLYPSLKPFMEALYPKGTMMLRHFRLKDTSFLKFFLSSADYKIEQISQIMMRYPKHRFVLIGDSGEHDPEVYAALYERFPENIQAIWIRQIENSNLSPQRFDTTFAKVPPAKWLLFASPQQLTIP